MPRRAREEDEVDPSKRARLPYSRGAIYRVKLHNFMSYTDAEIIDPGPQLNCIIGPNGTGKSSVVCALCVGLGGPLKITGRGDQIKACVHGNGHQKDAHGNLIETGFVETELVDGNGAGQNLVVRLDFDIKSKEVWRLDGSVVTKKEVKRRMEALNIQVDNPLQFLPQDKVGEFSNMSPEQLLKHTEMAIGPDVYAKHLQLIELDGDLRKSKERLVVEEKTLADLNASLDALKKDVERWKAYQANLEKLRQMHGKALWLRSTEAEDEMLSMKEEHDKKKKECKAAEQEKKRLDEKLKPLETLRAESARVFKDATKTVDAKVQGKNKLAHEMDGLLEAVDDKRLALGGVEAERQKVAKAREVAEAELQKNEDSLRVTREKLQAEFKQPVEQLIKQSREDFGRSQSALDEAQQKVDDHQRAGEDLHGAVDRAKQGLAQLNDVERLKMMLMRKLNIEAAQFAYEVGPEKENVPDVIGPLLMEIDVREASHRHLVEQVIGTKLLSSFIGRTEQARDRLNKLSGNKRLTIYRPGRAYEPRARPDVKELQKFGVTAWLDEALTMKPENKNDVLAVLKDIVSVDKVLLGTKKTAENIEALSQFLHGKQCGGVSIITPERIYRSNQSRYGNKAITTSTQMLKHPMRAFDNVVDPDVQKQRDAALKEAAAALKKHEAGRKALEGAVAKAEAAHEKVAEDKKAVDQRTTQVRNFEQRTPPLRQKAERARAKEADFDAEQRKRSMRLELQRAHEAVLAKTAELVRLIGEVEAASCKAHGAKLAVRAAEVELEESKAEKEDVERKMEAAKQEYTRLRDECKTKAKEVGAKLEKAREKAPEFEACAQLEKGDEEGGAGPSDGARPDAAAKAAWDALPGEARALEDEVEELESDTQGDVANKDALRQYQTKTAKIGEERERVESTRGEVAEKQRDLRATEAEWKPALHAMIATVDRAFATYFARFNCEGEVRLHDGRATDPETGDALPGAEDKYTDYKIHIRVKWRASEALHVLGEAGRDSGGERSVATMVYLISLQNINPAPFRVVDEINQAMDSTNERNVFNAITHACSEGGKQYFLLTPKLLPDLDYGRDTAIQFVFNGAYMQSNDALSLAACC